MNSTLKNRTESINLTFDELFYNRCEQFARLLQQWNKVHNLTGSCNDCDIEKNIIDSIYPLKFIKPSKTLVDIGTGAGYPGLILAMALPDTKVILVEPRAKRVAFLNYIKNILKLNNVEVIQDRVENIAIDDVDLITSRAVTNTKLLIELTKQISNNLTNYLFYKGSLLKEELKQIDATSYEIVNFEDRNYLYMKERS